MNLIVQLADITVLLSDSLLAKLLDFQFYRLRHVHKSLTNSLAFFDFFYDHRIHTHPLHVNLEDDCQIIVFWYFLAASVALFAFFGPLETVLPSNNYQRSPTVRIQSILSAELQLFKQFTLVSNKTLAEFGKLLTFHSK